MRIQGFRGNCDPKASWGCAPALPNQIQVVFLGELLLGKPIFSVRQKGVPPLLLPASVLQLPRCLVRICNLFHKDNPIVNWQVSKMQLQQEKQIAKSNLLRKCGLLAHTSAAFLKNCCTEKLLFACGSFPAANSIIPFHHKKTVIETSSVSMTVFHQRFCSY